MILVECNEEYWEFIRTLRNDKRVINGFIDNQLITHEQQVNYMKLNSNNYRVALLNYKPAGYIGVINEDFRICTHPDYQAKGVAKYMLLESIKIWPNASAKVKITNIASNKLFLSCGFILFKTDDKFNYYKI